MRELLNLRFKVENLGSIRKGEFTQKPLTIFCGPNNSGKTWAMYSLYQCHSQLNAMNPENPDSSNKTLRKFNRHIADSLADFFNTPLKTLQGVRFEIDIQAETWQQIIHREKHAAVFLMPAERNGLHLFFRELSARRTALLHHASKENINLRELLQDVIRSRYATPIADYIDWLNELTDIQRRASSGFHLLAQQLKREIVGGNYTVEKSTGNITFKPYQKKRDGIHPPSMGLHMSSSTVKSLFGLWFYLENQAKTGDLLMIDEPELNIHPENQRKIACLLAQLVNAGLNIVISTHSDYIVREFNSLLILNQDRDKKLRLKHGYRDEEVLDPQQVGAYLFDEQTIKPFEISPADGIYARTFDTVIRALNTVNDDIYYSLQEADDE